MPRRAEGARGGATVRPLLAADEKAARAMLVDRFAGSPHTERLLELLALAVRGDDPECRGLLAMAGGRLAGLSLSGSIAGTIGGSKVHVLESEERAGSDPGPELLQWTLHGLAGDGARYAIAEMPADSWFQRMRAALERAGFEEEARIEDLWRDGVALLILRRTLDPGNEPP